MTYKSYQSIEIETEVVSASPHRLIQILLEKGIQQINLARMHMQNNNIPNKCESISKAMDIINYLKITLNKDDPQANELSKHLDVVYQYADRMLLMANLKNDEKFLDEALKKMMEVKSAWDSMKVNENENS